MHLLVDTASDCTLITREDVNRTNTSTYGGGEISIHGLAYKQISSSDKFATLDIGIYSETVPIKGLAVSNICSPICMANPSANDEL